MNVKTLDLKEYYEMLSQASALATELGSQVVAGTFGSAGGDLMQGYTELPSLLLLTVSMLTTRQPLPLALIVSSLIAAHPCSHPQPLWPGQALVLFLHAEMLVGLRCYRAICPRWRYSCSSAQFSGKAFCEVATKSELALYTIRPGSFVLLASGQALTDSIESIECQADERSAKIEVLRIEQSEATVVDLTEADRIVSGGRSVGTKEKFDELIAPCCSPRCNAWCQPCRCRQWLCCSF